MYFHHFSGIVISKEKGSDCMHMFQHQFEWVNIILNFFSIFVLVWGVLKACVDFVRSEITTKNRYQIAKNNTLIKNYLGSYVLLSLEILIAADIIESIINPTFQDILKLGLVVLIRTVISYFLNMEIKEGMTEVDEVPKDNQD